MSYLMNVQTIQQDAKKTVVSCCVAFFFIVLPKARDIIDNGILYQRLSDQTNSF